MIRYGGSTASWRSGSIRNFVGESCLVAAVARVGVHGGIELDAASVHYAHACVGERSLPYLKRTNIEDARAFIRADGGYQVSDYPVWCVPGVVRARRGACCPGVV